MHFRRYASSTVGARGGGMVPNFEFDVNTHVHTQILLLETTRFPS